MKCRSFQEIIWFGNGAFLADGGKDTRLAGSVRWSVWPEQSIHEIRYMGNKASEVGRGYIVEGFPCQGEELQINPR